MSTLNNNKQHKFFYGWVIVAACLLIQAIPFGVASNLPPTFTNYVVNGEGFSYASFTLIFTIGTVVSAICSPFIGKIFTKVNVKLLFIIGSIFVGGGFMLYSLAGNKLIAYYIIAAIVQVGNAIVSAIGVPTLINAWFKVNKGRALGIAFCGGGIGNIVLQTLAGKWLTDPNIGYKGAYLRFGLIALIGSLLISIFLVRLPKSADELAANAPKKKLEGQEDVAHHISWGYTVGETTKMPQFWLIAASFIFIGFYVSGFALQFIPYFQSLEEKKILLISSATLASMFGLFSIFGNILGGILFDKLGLSKSFLLA
ncbi:MFS transporter, partial [Turicibacter sanguinis]|nr:MFS transporter [Turicibacter sanguinis]